MSPIGKLVIARELALFEHSDDEKWFVEDDHWYGHLWNRMREGTGNNPQAILNNHLRIITFNYDRSLEFALYRAIRNTYGIDEAVAQQVLDNLWIRHVYGALGPLHYRGLDGGGRPYGPIENVRELQLAADGIQTIPEARNNQARRSELQNWFEWAQDVAYMGFSFDADNIERLGVTEVLEARRERAAIGAGELPNIMACTYKMSATEIAVARKRACGAGVEWNDQPRKNLEFLRNLAILV